MHTVDAAAPPMARTPAHTRGWLTHSLTAWVSSDWRADLKRLAGDPVGALARGTRDADVLAPELLASRSARTCRPRRSKPHPAASAGCTMADALA